MAQALAQRYDGNHGFGTIQGIELGGEDYDSVPNTSYVPLANTMNLCYPALKGAYPNPHSRARGDGTAQHLTHSIFLGGHVDSSQWAI